MPLDLVALGMLLYVSTYYTGILGRQGNTLAAVFMAVVAILTLIVLGYAVPAASRNAVSRATAHDRQPSPGRAVASELNASKNGDATQGKRWFVQLC